MASVSKLKKMLDKMRFKYQKKREEASRLEMSKADSHAKILQTEILLEEILQDIQDIDSYCYGRNRY